MFQQRGNIETALNFLKNKSVRSFFCDSYMTDDDFPSVRTLRFIYKWHKQLFMFSQIKLVNINIPDIIEGKPSIILGLIWTIILHCHVCITMKRPCVFLYKNMHIIYTCIFLCLELFFSLFTSRPLAF